MKKSIILIVLTALTLSSCALDNPTSPGHTYDNMQRYAMNKFSNHVLYPAGIVNMMLKLDEYIGATEEEKKSEAFQWHRENIFHEDDVTFMIRGLGTVHTYGKRLMDPDSEWRMNGQAIFETVGEGSWKITQEFNASADICSIVTYSGKVENGKYIFAVEVDTVEERYTSYHSDTKVKSYLTTPEGPVTVIDPQPVYHHYGYVTSLPEGSGMFRIDTERNGQPLDWAELSYDKTGTSLIFASNL